MPGKDLSQDEFQQILEARPKGMSTDDAIRLAIKKGYTFGGRHVDPHTLIPYDDKLYSNHDEISNPRAAWEATKEALGTKIPGLDQFGEFLSQDAPEYIGRHTSNSQSSLVRGAGDMAGVASIVASNLVPRRLGDVALQALAGPVLEGAGVAGKALTETETAKSLGEFSTDLMSRAIGVAKPFIKNVKENTSVLKDISDNMQNVLDYGKMLSNIMDRGVQRLGRHLEAVEDRFIQAKSVNPDSLEKIPLHDTLKNLEDMMSKKRVATERPIPKISKIDVVSGKEAALVNDYADKIDKIKGNADILDLISLKRRLGNDIAWNKPEALAKNIGTEANGILKNLYKQINDKIAGASPELKGAGEAYAKGRSNYDLLRNKVFGDDASTAYQRTKLRIMRGVAPQTLLNRAAQISAESEGAMKNFIDLVSAQQFEPTVRKGIGGGFLGIGAAASVAGVGMAIKGAGPEAMLPILADLGAAALTSPRLAAKSILYGEALAGATKRGVEKVAEQGIVTRSTEQALSSRVGDQETSKESLKEYNSLPLDQRLR